MPPTLSVSAATLIPHLTTVLSLSPNLPAHSPISSACTSKKYPSPFCNLGFEADLTNTRSTDSRSLRVVEGGREKAGEGVWVPRRVKMRSWERKKVVLVRVELKGTGWARQGQPREGEREQEASAP